MKIEKIVDKPTKIMYYINIVGKPTKRSDENEKYKTRSDRYNE